MKIEQEFDRKVKEALQKACEEISVSDNLKCRIDEEISLKQEEKSMKHISMKKIGIGVAAACLLLSGAAFAGRTAYLQTDIGSLPEHFSYEEMEQAEERLGYPLDCVEQFSNGYTFSDAEVDTTAAMDEDGNKIYSYDEMCIQYEKAGEPGIALYIEKPVETFENTKTPDATRECGDIMIRYDVYTYKFVPVDYELTQEDMENEKKDNYWISYGSSEVEVKQDYSVSWDNDGVRYHMFGFDITLSPDELMDMAEEIINAQ